MNIDKLVQQLKDHNQHPPVERWDPPFCGDIDIEIKADGTWFYMGTPIGRKPLVKLFASVLTLRDGDYYLVTPVEKVRIKVEDAPFIITSWREHQEGSSQNIIFISNVDDEFILSLEYPIALPEPSQHAGLYLNIHRGMQAAIHRNTYYQLAEIAQVNSIDNKDHWQIPSGNEWHTIAIDG